MQTCSRNLAWKVGVSLLGNENELISRGYVLPDQPEFFIYLLQAVLVKTNSLR